MTDTEESVDFAKASDLLAPAEGEKEVVLKTTGKKIMIKRINIGELSDIVRTAKDDEIKQFIYLVFKGMTRPKLNIDETGRLPMKVIMEIAGAVSKFSELDKESIEQIQNLLGTKQ